MDIKNAIRAKLIEETQYQPTDVFVFDITSRFGWDNPKYATLEEPARRVMTAYQNANKWLDTMKEHILINLHCPYFSNIVHQLAHTMPIRFDKFGDILHLENLMIPYPYTEEWRESIGDLKSCINIIYDILDEIKNSLISFKKTADSLDLYHMSAECDALILDISKEYGFYYEVVGMLECVKSPCHWDKLCHEYYMNRSSLI